MLCLLAIFGLVPPWAIAALAAVTLLVVNRRVLASVDYSLLATFVAFFIFIGNMGNIGPFRDLLAVLAEHNVQGVSIANLQKDRTGLEIPRDWEGGLSGGPTYRASNELVRRTYREFGDRFAIAGIGGVFTPEQAYAKIRSGASLVMFISSLMYRGPQQITVLKRGLAELLRRDGFAHVSEAVGVDA